MMEKKTETKVIKAKSNQAFRRQVVSTSLILLFVSYQGKNQALGTR